MKFKNPDEYNMWKKEWEKTGKVPIEKPKPIYKSLILRKFIYIFFFVIISLVIYHGFLKPNLKNNKKEGERVVDIEQKKENFSGIMIRKIVANNIGSLINIIPEIINLNEILGKNHTQAEELKYLVALIEERMEQIWKKDKQRNRYYINPNLWNKIPFEQKEQILRVIYNEENTWWEIYDMYSGKCLGKAQSWGPKIY